MTDEEYSLTFLEALEQMDRHQNNVSNELKQTRYTVCGEMICIVDILGNISGPVVLTVEDYQAGWRVEE